MHMEDILSEETYQKKEELLVSVYGVGLNGTTEKHSKTVDIERDCYPRDFISPTAKEFTYNQNKILSTTINVSQSEDLRYAINLFLEFFGECELVKDDLSSISKIKITRRLW